jgi:hypothetical protein
MGNISSAYANPFAVNYDNPASYASLKLTTYEAAGEGSTRTVRTPSGDKYSTGTATLSYINVGIPVGKYAGFSFGLRPFSRSYYDLRDTNNLANVGNVINTYFGEGSTTYGYLGLAGKYEGFSLGFNFGYLFGTIDYNTATQAQSDTSRYASGLFRNSNKVGGIYWKGGAMYETDLNKKLKLRVGGTFTMSQDLDVKQSQYWISFTGTVTDTAYEKTTEQTITLPTMFSFGAQLAGTDKWMAGIDVSMGQWSQFRKFGNVDSVDNSMRIGLGGEYTPDAANKRSYLSRVTYRLGFNYGTEYIRLANSNINYYSVTAGFSLPFKRTTDRIHTAFEVGQRGNNSNGLLKETFVRFSLGISLNDRWFIKRKYD